MGQDKEKLLSRNRAESIRKKRFSLNNNVDNYYQSIYIGGNNNNVKDEEYEKKSESSEELDQEYYQNYMANYNNKIDEVINEETDENFYEETRKKSKQKQIQAAANNFLGIKAKKGPVGSCPVCKEKSIYFSTKASDKLLGAALLGASGNYMATYYCMNPSCPANWKSGKCRRKFNATAADTKKFDKSSTLEYRRIFRID